MSRFSSVFCVFRSFPRWWHFPVIGVLSKCHIVLIAPETFSKTTMMILPTTHSQKGRTDPKSLHDTVQLELLEFNKPGQARPGKNGAFNSDSLYLMRTAWTFKLTSKYAQMVHEACFAHNEVWLSHSCHCYTAYLFEIQGSVSHAAVISCKIRSVSHTVTMLQATFSGLACFSAFFVIDQLILTFLGQLRG